MAHPIVCPVHDHALYQALDGSLWPDEPAAVRRSEAWGKLLAYAECEEAWAGYRSGAVTQAEAKAVLFRHGNREDLSKLTIAEFLSGLRREGLSAAKETTR